MSAFRAQLSGEIDLAREAELQSVCERFLDSHEVDAEIDLSEVTFMDTTGLSVLLRLHRTAHERGGKVTLVGPPTTFVRVLELTCTAPLFAVTGVAVG